MSVRKIAVLGHPVLRQIAAPVPEKEILTVPIQTLIRDMVDTMFEYDGRGLAAPQIHESIQLVVMIWDFLRIDKYSHLASDTLINFAPHFIILTLILIIICYKRGERPRFQWGEKSID